MKLFGSITELVAAVFRKNSQAVTLRPSQTTTYTADRDIQFPPGDAAHVLTSADSTQTLTNKTIAGASNTLTVLAGTQLSGQTPIANGGTGQATANTALNALLPSQGSNSGKVLKTDGTDTSWIAVATTVTTTRGDLIRRGAAVDERFAAVTNNRVVRGDGTDVVSGQIDATGFFTTGAELTQSAPGIVKNAGQLLGTNTNDSAASGYVGEVLTQSRVRSAALGRTTGQSGTAFNVTATALTLTAGDWDLEGSITVEDGGAGTNITSLAGGTSLTTATLPTGDAIGVPNASGEVTMPLKYSSLVISGQTTLSVARHRVTVSNGATAVFYLVCTPTFTVNNLNVWGYLTARRVR